MRPGPKPGAHRDIVRIRVPNGWAPRDVPAFILPTVRKRVAGIVAGYAAMAMNGGQLDLESLASSAYLQGLDDTVEVHERNPGRFDATDRRASVLEATELLP